MTEKTNIVLIGMPGAGKSTVGVIAAKMLGMRFVDADLLIQEREGALLSQIIEREGVEGFLRIEEEVCASIKGINAVIATGGSAVYGDKGMQHLKEIGDVVYLSLSYTELEKRLGDLKNRGVVLKEGQTLQDLYDERTPLYEKYADLTVCEDGFTIEETLQNLIEAL